MPLPACPTRMVLTLLTLAIAAPLHADVVELADGTKLEGCYARDEGTQYVLWSSIDAVGGPGQVYPRSAVKSYELKRGEAWDARPQKPDLTVTFIEINPKLAGLHGRVHYDELGRPRIAGASALADLGDEGYLHPERTVEKVKLRYAAGEPITLTAHVKNIGFATAEPFEYVWEIGDEVIDRGRHDQPLEEMEEATFQTRWSWQDGMHEVTFRIVTGQPEIATMNNAVTDPLWGMGLVYVVNPGRVNAWHEFRSAYGTFSFEDFYRWHITIMNQLFELSVYPSSPKGIQARVRLDRIIYSDTPQATADGLFRDDGLRYDQGMWVWRDDPSEIETGQWVQVDHKWRNSTEWSLPHELGHQLGLIDWYNLDHAGDTHHVWPDTGEKVTHFQRYPLQMMHWHGPHVFGEADAGYLNMTWDRPRGFFGDICFAIPRENLLHIVDINGDPVDGALVEIFQRGAVVDQDAAPGEDRGVRFYPVVENGDFGQPVSQLPVIVGETDRAGMLRLPNRPAAEVRTLNGFHRQDNPFGNVNVVGQRGLMLVKVTKHERPCYYWLDLSQFVDAWFRGQKERFTLVLRTPYGSVDSPRPPADVRAEQVDADHVKVSWTPPAQMNEQNYLEHLTGFQIFRRVSSDGLNDRPWFAVGTVGPEAKELVIDLREFPRDIYWYAQGERDGKKVHAERFGVTTLGPLSRRSALAETVLK